MDQETIKASMNSFRTGEGAYRWDNHGYKAIPWINTYISSALSRLGMEGASQTLLDTIDLTTTTFGFPEAIRPDGIFHKTWYPTVHASFVHALNLLLVKRRGDVVEVFTGIPDSWGDVSFKNLLIPNGLLVSAQRNKQHLDISVKNTSHIQQSITIKAFKNKKAVTKKILLDSSVTEVLNF
jgi:hypothetical protein